MKDFLEINGTKIRYSDMGAGFPVVFTHAGIADSRMWDDQISAVTKEFRMVTYDMRGFGESPYVAGRFSRYDDLLGLLDALKIERCVLVGCSMGGMAVIDAALADPKRVAGLVVVASMANGLELDGEFEDFPQMEEAIETFKSGELERSNELEVQMWVDGFKQPAGRAPEAIREKVRLMNGLAIEHAANAPEKKQIDLEPVAATRLDEITMPLLLINGTLDEPYTMRAMEVLAEKIPGAKHVVIPDVAHLPNMEAPEVFNREVLAFARKVAS